MWNHLRRSGLAADVSLLGVVVATIVSVPGRPASAYVVGGGPKKTDCYAAWQVTTPTLAPAKGTTRITCEDGDPRCDVDGLPDGTCTLGVSICVLAATSAGCSATQVTSIDLQKAARSLSVALPPLPASTATCGDATVVSLPLQKSGKKPSKVLRFGLVAKATSRRDKDTLVLQCVPNRGAGECPANPDGGPRELRLVVPESGTDLDNGWTGISHDFPVVSGTTIRACLRGCSDTNPACTGDESATDAVNGRTFGAPLPILAVSSNCIVSRYDSPKITDISANVQTGEIQATLHLLADVYLTPGNQICPRCSGTTIGATGTCDSGARAHQACRTEGVIRVSGASGNKNFTVSSDCPPTGTPLGPLAIPVPLTTGTSTLPGPRPCSASKDDNCSGACTTGGCAGNVTCAAMTAGAECVDVKGGIAQACCADNTSTPCFPTSGNGAIVRTGTAAVPAPPLPDLSYPKIADGVLAATSCEEATNDNTFNGVVGLPGPAALILPVHEQWTK